MSRWRTNFYGIILGLSVTGWIVAGTTCARDNTGLDASRTHSKAAHASPRIQTGANATIAVYSQIWQLACDYGKPTGLVGLLLAMIAGWWRSRMATKALDRVIGAIERHYAPMRPESPNWDVIKTIKKTVRAEGVSPTSVADAAERFIQARLKRL